MRAVSFELQLFESVFILLLLNLLVQLYILFSKKYNNSLLYICDLGDRKSPHSARAAPAWDSINFREFSPCIARARRAHVGLTVYPPSRRAVLDALMHGHEGAPRRSRLSRCLFGLFGQALPQTARACPCSDSVCLAGGPSGALYGTGLARMAYSLPWHYFWHIALLECQ
jgi:hypothetical protein